MGGYAEGMDLGAPLLDIAPGVRGELLQTLARLERPVSRRELASLAGVAPGHASSVVQELIDGGLVSETTAGRSSMVILNRHHLAVDAIVGLAGLRGELIRRLRRRVSRWPDVDGAWMFGSIARGEGGSQSDIDVLLVVDDPDAEVLHDRLSTLHADVRSWTGNDLQLVEHSTESWRKLVRAKNPLVEEIRRDGITLTNDAKLLLARTR